MVGDASGALASLVSLSARSPTLNLIAQEAALHLAPLGLELAGVHVWSEENVWADDLSRLAEGAAIPHALADVPLTVPKAWQDQQRRVLP